MPLMSKMQRSLQLAMRAHGLPTPSTAVKATLGWSAVTAYALVYQVSVRESCMQYERPIAEKVTRRHTCFVKPWELHRDDKGTAS